MEYRVMFWLWCEYGVLCKCHLAIMWCCVRMWSTKSKSRRACINSFRNLMQWLSNHLPVPSRPPHDSYQDLEVLTISSTTIQRIQKLQKQKTKPVLLSSSVLPFTQPVFLHCANEFAESLQTQSWISCVFLLSSVHVEKDQIWVVIRIAWFSFSIFLCFNKNTHYHNPREENYFCLVAVRDDMRLLLWVEHEAAWWSF